MKGNNMDFDRITHPLRLAKGSHQPGSGKGCAMNVISYINGDSKITDYPACSARPLAALVQSCNDWLADDDGFLSPTNSMLVLDLGWQTVGTAGVPDSVVHAWMAECLDSEWGISRFANPSTAAAIRTFADPVGFSGWGGVVKAAERVSRNSFHSAPLYLRISFATSAIAAWRRLAQLDPPTNIPANGVADALTRIGGTQ